MMFFFKKKPIVLDCFTAMPHVYMFSKPQTGSKVLPDWWRKLPTITTRFDFNANDNPINARSCPGIIDFYRLGVAISLWSDLDILVGPVQNPYMKYQYSDRMSTASAHPHVQYQGFAAPEAYQHLKLINPWYMRTKESINWVCTTPLYNNVTPADFIVAPGVTNFKYQPATHVQMLIKRHETQATKVELPFGHPLLMYHPMSDRAVDIRTHLVTAEEHHRLGAQGSLIKFSSSGLLARKLLTKGTAQVCPFSGDSK